MLDVAIEEHTVRMGLRLAVSFQRTLRIPDDGRTYPLPPGLGAFPIHRVADYEERLPAAWREQGGIFIAMYQREALWLGLTGAVWKPNAVKVEVGRINAVSGDQHQLGIGGSPQDYLVVPPQLWLDGIKSGHDSIRQFVAMPLQRGYTIEASLTGEETHGGIQITAFEPKPGRFPDEPPPPDVSGPQIAMSAGVASQSMGLGAGGMMRQKVYADPYGPEVWDQENFGQIIIHILNSAQFHEVTGEKAPETPIDAATYNQHNLPWFDLYDEVKRDVVPSQRLSEAKTIAQRDAELGSNDEANQSFDISETQIKYLHDRRVTPDD